MTKTAEKVFKIGHSPDPDDAFMFYAMAKGIVKIPGWRIEHVMEDIQSLNQRAFSGELEMTAISAHAYPKVADRYGILHCGASMGRGYGPIVVSKKFIHPERAMDSLKGKRIAVPGPWTTAFLLLNLALEDYIPVQADFAAIMGMVERGEVDAGLIIHEGQITYREQGFFKVLDLGHWWKAITPLPLPLGLDVVRRDLGPELLAQVSVLMRESIDYAIEHEDEAVPYALQFGRGIDEATGRRFVRMYVNRDTQDMHGEGVAALKLLFEMAVSRGLLDKVPDLTLF
ncbi:MAG: MqnA/MqnD/SBP family protein [candidate division FCPU426 bacterium]